VNPVPHIPALRCGRPYESLEKSEVRDHRSGEVKALVSQVNAGVIRKDLQRVSESRAALRRIPVADLLEMARRAGDLFLKGTLPLGADGQTQTPRQYIETLSATSGLPHVLIRRNMAKIDDALRNMPAILSGLSRGLDLSLLDDRRTGNGGPQLSFYAATQALGLVMPSNSPAVNSLWLPAIALKIPVMIKPGKEEPWTPFRLVQAFVAAGCPPEAFGFYPTDHEGAAEILKSCGRALLFGDKSTTQLYANNPAIEIHGPGYSKIIIGEDQIERWPEFIDVLVSSISDNGGRSCINASAIIVPKYAAEIADALAQQLGPVGPTRPDDETARLSGFANPKMAASIDQTIEEGLKSPGATEVTLKYRNGPRHVVFEGGTYLRPTIVLCESMMHPLANREFLFPYATVIQVAQRDMLKQIGPSLVITALTADAIFREALLDCPLIDRLNLGPIPTTKISWDQPHEGNMFEFLYKRRAIAQGDLPAVTASREPVGEPVAQPA
jgi:hypothetical protein